MHEQDEAVLKPLEEGTDAFADALSRIAHDLLPKHVRDVIPPLGASCEAKDPVALVKYFTPDNCWTWYALEGCAITPDGDEVPLKEMGDVGEYEDVSFFGYVEGLDKELGYFSYRELSAARGQFTGLGIERDLWFKPTPLSELQKGHV